MPVRPSWIAFGWFIAAAVTALVLLVLYALGLADDQQATADGDMWAGLAMVIGFFTGGFFAGARVGAAPALHGVGIGVFSLVVWLLANLFFGEVAALSPWTALPLAATAMLLALQTVAAIVGARAGIRWTRQPETPR
jgi:putative membrane protein (TIGR04086 family)